MFTVLWCYLRNPTSAGDVDYHNAADLTGQANHLGVTIRGRHSSSRSAPTTRGYNALKSARPARSSTRR